MYLYTSLLLQLSDNPFNKKIIYIYKQIDGLLYEEIVTCDDGLNHQKCKQNTQTNLLQFYGVFFIFFIPNWMKQLKSSSEIVEYNSTLCLFFYFIYVNSSNVYIAGADIIWIDQCARRNKSKLVQAREIMQYNVI